MAVKVHFCKQGFEGIVFCILPRFGWLRFDIPLTGALFPWVNGATRVGAGSGSFGFPLALNDFALMDNADYRTSDHQYFITCTSYNRHRTNTTGRSTADIEYPPGSGLTQTLYFVENLTDTINANTGVYTANIHDGYSDFLTGDYVYTGSDYGGAGGTLHITFGTETISGAGLIRTRTYSWSLDINGIGTGVESGTLTEVDTQSNPLTDATLNSNATTLLDWADANGYFNLSSGSSPSFVQVGYDGSGSEHAQGDTSEIWLLYYCNPVNAGVGLTPKRAMFLAGPILYVMSRYKLQVGSDVWCIKLADVSEAPAITGSGYTTFNEYGTWGSGLPNDGVLLNTTIPGSSIACADYSQTPCDSSDVELDEPTTTDAGNTIYGVNYLLPEQSC